MRNASRRNTAGAPRADLHEQVTQKIVAAIEAGAGEWQMPWHRPGTAFDIPKNAQSGKHYQGSNILSLWIDADEKKFPTQTWATFKQWQELGAQVRKGEKGSLIVKYGRWTPKQDRPGAPAPKAKPNGSAGGSGEDSAERLYARAAWVFNSAQVDGYADPALPPRADLTTRLAHVDAFIANTGAEFREGGTRAFYRHRSASGEGDFIQMPPRNLFTGTATSTPTEAYESTRCHELCHWSGADHRLKREFGRFGDHRYAVEELVAELGASFLCAELGITNAPRPDHAQYLAHWLAVLKQESRAIFTAASAASRAVAYLGSLQPAASVPADETEDEDDGEALPIGTPAAAHPASPIAA
jgi:antirestriction protein ArdC